MKYKRIETPQGWIITDNRTDYNNPIKCATFAFDTETFAYIDGQKLTTEDFARQCLQMQASEVRERVTTAVWCWQCYDEFNGFFMTSSFDLWLDWQARCGYKFGWCYNAKFDFSQVDYKILSDDKWKPHEHREKGSGKAYDKGQAWTYESLHNDMGSRYAYKLWIEYRHTNRHKYTHSVEYRDFMNIFAGGLARMLESLKVVDNDGNPVRKLEMDYQSVDTEHLTDEEIDYCKNDVKGLYFGVKQFSRTIEEQSDGERRIFGSKTNVMTAGGFAKAELLRSLYPGLKPYERIKQYQREHPLTAEQDKWLRDNHLYRGGISVVNPRYQGLLLTAEVMGRPMKRYDVNSEYPFAMANIRDLIGAPTVKKYSEYLQMTAEDREDYECILMINSIYGELKYGYIPVWYNPFVRDYVSTIDEHGLHLMFEREFDEMMNWYENVEISCDYVLLYRRGDYVYKPFIMENYELKAQAKRDNNKALANVVKLKLNSSYGKLSERVIKQTGKYVINPETNAVHFVATGEEINTDGMMCIAVGALVTSVARVWILSHIREVCGEEIAKKFVYIDTDSIHAFADYSHPDPLILGELKDEATCVAVKYIAPKTYIDIEKVVDGYIPFNDKHELCMEVHAKGINITAVMNDFIRHSDERGVSLDYVNKRFAYGEQFPVLCAMNVQGGKVLIPTNKYLARAELDPHNPVVYNTGYDGTFLSEI